MTQRHRTEKSLDLRQLLVYCRSNLAAMLRCLQQAVEIESPSGSKADIDRMADFFDAEFKRQGGRVRVLPHPSAGAAMLAEFWGEKRGRTRKQKPILLLGHHDTVWDRGT